MIKYLSTGNFWKPTEEPSRFTNRKASRVPKRFYSRVTVAKCTSVTTRIHQSSISRLVAQYLLLTWPTNTTIRSITLTSTLFRHRVDRNPTTMEPCTAPLRTLTTMGSKRRISIGNPFATRTCKKHRICITGRSSRNANLPCIINVLRLAEPIKKEQPRPTSRVK
jgi:hypothetical protein